MGSQLKQSLSGNIHRIREFELEKWGEGWFGKILLVEHKATDTEMVLKALPKPYTSIKDFYREFHYGLHLGVHKNIITAYDVAFETAGFYVFSQEYAPLVKFYDIVDTNSIIQSLQCRRQSLPAAQAFTLIARPEPV
ncbi:hypothetical protein NQ317_003322 [Molorchus minor]|uniref:Protein kinase domain-containing protein n=1 Tax=Molorchus minor TaxID=1323400 RepID=A0ABQ9J092_9CUCU|nr:hypothetical protein NQ317_003322 [Molorchus minor]